MALEPEREARLNPTTMDPDLDGTAGMDAIEIFSAIRAKPKCVLDADISKCFDRIINHEALLDKLNTLPSLAEQGKALKKPT